MTQFHNIESYTEFKMKLDLLGLNGDYPPERIFNLAITAKGCMEKLGFKAYTWSKFCEAIQWRLDNGIPLSTMNTINSGLML